MRIYGKEVSGLWAYLLAGLVLASVDITHESKMELDTPEGPASWISEVGFRHGTLVLGNHEPPGGGIHAGVHAPEFAPLPIYAGAGPEGGGLFVSTALIVTSVWLGHLILRRRKRTPWWKAA